MSRAAEEAVVRQRAREASEVYALGAAMGGYRLFHPARRRGHIEKWVAD